MLEAVITIVIVAIIVAGVGLLSNQLFRFRNIIDETLSTEQELGQVISPFVTELRSAQISSTGIYPIEAASTSSITFYSDVNKDGLVERLRYFLDGQVLKRGVVAPSGNPPSYNLGSETVKEMLHGIIIGSAGIFAYFGVGADMDSAPMSSPITVDLIRTVKISVTVDKNPAESPGSTKYETSATPRNLRTP